MLSLLLALAALAQTPERTIVDLIEEANRQCTSGQGNACAARIQSGGDPGPTVSTRAAGLVTERVTIRDHLGRDLPIDVIPESEIRRLRNLYPSNLRIYDDEVCAQRAHTIGHTLGNHGIETVKLVLEPGWLRNIIPDERARNSRGTTPRWEYHVVNMIYARNDRGELVEYIIDPFMESHPVPRARWEARLRSNRRSSISTIQVASRYVLDPNDTRRREMEYDTRVLQRSYAIMRGEPKF